MHSTPIVASLALVSCLVCSSPTSAGIYIPEMGYPRVAGGYPRLKDEVDKFRGTAAPPVQANVMHPQRVSFLERVASLEALRRRGLLDNDGRINLGGYLLRLNQPEQAREALESIAPSERNYLALLNLAAAYFQTGLLDRAVLTQNQAIEAWPEAWPGLSAGELSLFLRVEKLNLELMRSRLQARPGPVGEPPDSVDELFPGLKFVGPDGEYAVGELALTQRAKLPPDSLDLVAYMLLGMPLDDRLTWMLAELLNVYGQVGPAAELMHELVFGRNFSPRSLRLHRNILMEARPAVEALNTPIEGLQPQALLLWLLSPRNYGAGLPLGAAGLFPEAGLTIPLASLMSPVGLPPIDVQPPPPIQPWLPDLRAALIGLAIGIVVGVLLTLQVQSSRRKQNAGHSPPPIAIGGAKERNPS